MPLTRITHAPNRLSFPYLVSPAPTDPRVFFGKKPEFFFMPSGECVLVRQGQKLRSRALTPCSLARNALFFEIKIDFHHIFAV